MAPFLYNFNPNSMSKNFELNLVEYVCNNLRSFNIKIMLVVSLQEDPLN